MKNPVWAYKSLSPNEYTITPFNATAPFSYTYVSGSSNNSLDVNLQLGIKYYPQSSVDLRVQNKMFELYDSVIQTFYSAIPYNTYGTTKRSYIPSDSVYVVSIAQDVFGEKLVPGTVSIQVNSSKAIDDTKGNLFISASGTGSIIGRVFYDKGVAVIKPKPSPNINPDPLWAQGNSNDGTGWEFLLETCHTNDLYTKGVQEPYPGTPTLAAKIGTRTGTYWSGGNFYQQSVTLGQTYKISGWVYAGANTYRGIKNNNVPGSDYPIGYQLTYLDSSNAVIGYETITTKQPTDTTLGDYGWTFLSKRVKILDSNISSFMIAAFIDGPYPYVLDGLGNPIYGDPSCNEQQSREGCPGYAWFADFRIENMATLPTTSGLDTTGLYITGGMSLTTNFSSSVTLHEHAIKVRIDPAEYNVSPYNPTVENSLYTGSVKTPIEMMTSRSKQPQNAELLAPYITTIGLYNPNNELMAVAKVSNPIQRTFDSAQTFILKFDT